MSALLWPILALALTTLAALLLIRRRAELRARDAQIDTRIAARVDWDAPDPDEDVPPAFRGIL